jgi:serine/threonine protein phosphatase 1
MDRLANPSPASFLGRSSTQCRPICGFIAGRSLSMLMQEIHRRGCMRTLAIGDIHGCSIAFDTLLGEIRVRSGDTLVLLGNCVDKGPDSAGVLERILRISRVPELRLVCLRGPHEQMMLDARAGGAAYEHWLNNGGEATLRSYSCFGDPGCLRDVPAEHWELLGNWCVEELDAATRCLVHAGVYGELRSMEQPAWNRGWLTCLDVGNGRLWQSNQLGESRLLSIDDLHRTTADPGLPAR